MCPKSAEKSWLPVPSEVTTKLRIMPNLLRLTWNNRPMQFEADKGWGYYITAEEHQKTVKQSKKKKDGKEIQELDATKNYFVKIPHKVRFLFMHRN